MTMLKMSTMPAGMNMRVRKNRLMKIPVRSNETIRPMSRPWAGSVLLTQKAINAAIPDAVPAIAETVLPVLTFPITPPTIKRIPYVPSNILDSSSIPCPLEMSSER
jgi:hypothetical protein